MCKLKLYLCLSSLPPRQSWWLLFRRDCLKRGELTGRNRGQRESETVDYVSTTECQHNNKTTVLCFFRGVWLKWRELDASRAVALNKLTRQSPFFLPFKSSRREENGRVMGADD